MRIAILTNAEASYPKPMAEGLARMLNKLGVDTSVFYSGWDLIRRSPELRGCSPRTITRQCRNAIRLVRRRRLLRKLSSYQAVIVVSHVPAAFLNYFLDDVPIAQALPDTPIVLYDLVYLPTRGDWGRWLRQGNPRMGIPEGGHFGMERYDWYLCVSVVSETAMPGGVQPYTRIGLNLDDGTLYPEQRGRFAALVDFNRPDHPDERFIQLDALREAGIPFVELKGKYSIPAIRRIYRESSIYFLAHRESFGLPICEIQACGGTVLTPYASWAPSHGTKADLQEPGLGKLPSNFVVYENDRTHLMECLRQIRSDYDSEIVRERFLNTQPELYYGDRSALQTFLDSLAAGRIHSRLHLSHRTDGHLSDHSSEKSTESIRGKALEHRR